MALTADPTTGRPHVLPVDPSGIPDDLRDRPQWAAWKAVLRDGKWTKEPRDPRTMRGASSTDPSTWGTLTDALRRVENGHADGVGYVLSPDDPYVFVDLDSCRNPSTCKLSGLAADLVERFASWTEVSPSGTGLHIIIRGKLPEGCKSKNNEHGIECYDSKRYFCCTGDTVFDAPIQDRQTELDAFVAKYLTREQSTRTGATAASVPAGVDSQRIIGKMLGSRNGEKIRRLMAGDLSDHNGDASSADLALCNSLAFWCDADPKLMDEIFRSSGLYRPKWDEQRGDNTYGEITITQAVEGCSKTYGWEARRKAKQKKRKSPQVLNDPEGNPSPDDEYVTIRADETTDSHAADLFVEHCGHQFRYVAEWKSWIGWTGKRWQQVGLSQVMNSARAVGQHFFGLACKIMDPEIAEVAIRTGKRFLSTQGMTQFLKQAEGLLLVKVADLNNDPWLFNVSNGTLDLREFSLKPHDPEDMMTQLCPVRYHPGAESPIWQGFLESTFRDHPDVIPYLHRLLGSSLVGIQREHLLPIFWGSGSNGKSVLIEALISTMGPDYACQSVQSLIMDQGNNQQHPTELADLFGKRFVSVVESEQGRKLKESQIKQITGGDRIRARRMREDFWEFQPSHLLIMATNHKPRVTGDDFGVWRRLKLVPFTRTFSGNDADPELPDKLKREQPGILAWLVHGCKLWSQSGLCEPETVRAATASYRDESDIFAQFVESECHVNPGFRVKFSTLFDRLREFADESGENLPSRKRFGEWLSVRYDKIRSGGIWYSGLDVVEHDR